MIRYPKWENGSFIFFIYFDFFTIIKPAMTIITTNNPKTAIKKLIT